MRDAKLYTGNPGKRIELDFHYFVFSLVGLNATLNLANEHNAQRKTLAGFPFLIVFCLVAFRVFIVQF